MPLRLPVQATVDRRVPLAVFLVAQNITDANGKVIQILEAQVGGNESGALPGDPAWFPNTANPRAAVCNVLSSRAAARCRGGPGYF